MPAGSPRSFATPSPRRAKCEGAVVISDPLIKDVEASEHAELLTGSPRDWERSRDLTKGRADLLAVALGEHTCQPKRRLFLGMTGDAYLLQARLNVSLPAWSASSPRRSSTPRTGPALLQGHAATSPSKSTSLKGKGDVRTHQPSPPRFLSTTAIAWRPASSRHRHRNRSGNPQSCLPRALERIQVEAGVLNVGYARTALLTARRHTSPRLALRHLQLVDVAPLLASAGYRVIVPLSARLWFRRSSFPEATRGTDSRPRLGPMSLP